MDDDSVLGKQHLSWLDEIYDKAWKPTIPNDDPRMFYQTRLAAFYANALQTYNACERASREEKMTSANSETYMYTIPKEKCTDASVLDIARGFRQKFKGKGIMGVFHWNANRSETSFGVVVDTSTPAT